MDKILVKNLLVRGVIGVSDRERANPQDIVINLVMYSDVSACGVSDNIHDTVNYRTVAKEVMAHAETIGRYTVEALAEDIAKICLKFSGINGVQVRVEKPGAVRFSESVGVEIERFRK